MSIPLLSIIAKSGSGKTTLIEKLIPLLRQRGFRIATIKHHFHADFDIDIPGKDSWRHAQAGAEHVILASSSKVASIRQLSRELTIDEITAEIKDVDLIIAEGFKTPGKPKLEVVRAAHSQALYSAPAELIAIASDMKFDLPVPQFDLNDVESIAEFVIAEFLS